MLLNLETQKEHYESYIRSNDEWKYAGLYFDEGISGTSMRKRDGLKRLVDDCDKGLIDIVLTKSISRFCRNTTDCLAIVRKMGNIGVTIIFEKEKIDTSSMDSELMLSILASMAEEESVSISENTKWSIKKRFQDGTYVISYPPYGYANVDGEMVIVPEEAETIKKIFADLLDGKSTHRIAEELNDLGIHTRKGPKWNANTINGIIKNEKYTGDVIFQKTFTDDGFKRHRNNGDYDQFFCENHHEAIISHEMFEKANELISTMLHCIFFLIWNQDELVIENYLKLISLVGDTLEKYTVEEKIEGFRVAETEIAKLKSDIEASPTEFSYDYVYSKLDELSFSIRERYDDLYQSSRPECSIFLSNNSVYVNEQTAEIAITFRNSDDKQDADAVEITIQGSTGAIFTRCDKKFTSVRSGEEQDYLATFSLDDKVISDGQFEITVSMQYRYRDSVANIMTTTISEILPITITDKENFVRRCYILRKQLNSFMIGPKVVHI